MIFKKVMRDLNSLFSLIETKVERTVTLLTRVGKHGLMFKMTAVNLSQNTVQIVEMDGALMVDTRTCIGCNHEWTVFDQTSDCEYTPSLRGGNAIKIQVLSVYVLSCMRPI